MSRIVHLRGFPVDGVLLRARPRARGVLLDATALTPLAPGLLVPPGDPPPPPSSELVAHLARFQTPADGGTGTAVPDLSLARVTVSRNRGPAPFGVAFQLVSSDPSWSSFIMFGTAVWTFSADADENYAFRHLDGVFAGDTAGTAHGPYVGHVYVKTGTHAWSVTLHYPGLASRTITSSDGATNVETGGAENGVIVYDANAYFDDPASLGLPNEPNRTHWFSDDTGTYADAAALRTAVAVGYPAAASMPLDRFTVGLANIQTSNGSATNKAGMPRRWLLQAGRTYALTNATRRLSHVNCFVDRWGSGADPIVTLGDTTGIGDGAFFRNEDKVGPRWSAVNNIDIRGLYDAASPGTGAKPWYGTSGIAYATNTKCRGSQIFRCSITGCFNGIDCDNGLTGSVWADTGITSWHNYGVWPAGMDDGAMLGLSVKQKTGAVNIGRKFNSSTATGADTETYRGSTYWTNRFDWALGVPVPKTGAPAVPPGYEAPTSGLWGTHPGGTAAWDWWVANWEVFNWPDPQGKGRNRDAFSHRNDDLYTKCAIHGPIRVGTANMRGGLHQCELRSLNGWGEGVQYQRVVADIDQTNAYAHQMQPCIRFIAAVGSVAGLYAAHTSSIWRLACEGGQPPFTMEFQRDNQPEEDEFSLGLGIVIDGLVAIAGGDPAIFPLGGVGAGGVNLNQGRVALRNAVIYAPSVGVVTSRSGEDSFINLIGGTSTDTMQPAYAYNCTAVFDRDSPNRDLVPVRFQPGRRILHEWNNLFVNSATFATAPTLPVFTGLGSTPSRITAPDIGHVPLPGSSATGAASGLVPQYDALGRLRSQATVGAFEG